MTNTSNYNDDWEYNNEEEAEMGQLHAIHNNMNHVAAVQRKLAEQALQPSAKECQECGDEIPEARQKAMLGVEHCVYCQQLKETGRR